MHIVMPLLGGVLVGTSASLLLAVNGRVAGISGVLAGALESPVEARWRRLFLAGLVGGGLLLRVLAPSLLPVPETPWFRAILAGLLVGFGARLGGGCTSGHGVCGISRGSPSSLVATMTFIATGMLATGFVFHVLGASR